MTQQCWTFSWICLPEFPGFAPGISGKKQKRTCLCLFSFLWFCSSWERQYKECCAPSYMSFTLTAGFTLIELRNLNMHLLLCNGFPGCSRYELAILSMVLQHISIGCGSNQRTCTTPCKKTCPSFIRRNVRHKHGAALHDLRSVDISNSDLSSGHS